MTWLHLSPFVPHGIVISWSLFLVAFQLRSLKTKEEAALCMVSESRRNLIYASSGVISVKPKPQAEAPAPVVTDSESENESNGNASDCEPPDAEPQGVSPLFPMGTSEATSREMLNQFGHVGQTKREILDLAPGGASMAYAACRDCYRYTGIVGCPEHGRVLKASLILLIMKDFALGRKDGFANTRFLTKTRSLGSAIDEEKAAACEAVESLRATAVVTPAEPREPTGPTAEPPREDEDDSFSDA